MKKRIAAVTMCYNEKHQLPRWIRHYSAQVGGYEHLYVVDHGSEDGSTENLGPVNVKKLTRSDGQGSYQRWRVELISELCTALLNDYDFVLYTDADELVVPDPVRFRTLYAYVSSTASFKGTAIGYDILHDVASEDALDWRFISEQRSVAQLVAAVCKPVLANGPIRWAPGFHGSTQQPLFGDLYLFHLRYVDQTLGHKRLEITRAISRPDIPPTVVDHHKIDSETFTRWIQSWLKYPRNHDGVRLENPQVSKLAANLEFKKDAAGFYGADYSFRSNDLFVIDEAFRFAF